MSTHPRSHFVTGLIAARSAPDRRLALRGRDFAAHHRGGETERRTLGSAAEIRGVLENEFLIRLPDHPGLDARLNSQPG
jgi:N-hydroxyarylamine O-acetyltransferase